MTRYFRAPGRVNLIGEHTDYSEGLVMPVAIQLATTIAHTPRSDRRLIVRSESMNQSVDIDLARPLEPQRRWSDYVVGVARTLMEEGCAVRGADMVISSTVPRGAGLSSSAALEVSAGFAMATDARFEVDLLRLAQCCQRAENTFVGARCGIMDQYVACRGREGDALLIDCRSLESRSVTIPSAATIVVLNTMVKHAHATGAYNARRADCETAVALLAERLRHVRTLRDVESADLAAHEAELPPRIFRRARHVVTENQRVREAGEALARGDLETCGRLMADSHRSLRDDYEVSAAELDLMVELAASEAGVYGTRMTGGGFGGCTVSLVESSAADRFVHSMRRRYADATGRGPDAWLCLPSRGVHELTGPQ